MFLVAHDPRRFHDRLRRVMLSGFSVMTSRTLRAICISSSRLSIWMPRRTRSETVSAISDGRRWRSLDELYLATVAWVGWYNHDRLHSARDDRPPAEYEIIRTDNTPTLSTR